MDSYSLKEILEIAKAQKGVLWCIVANFLFLFFSLKIPYIGLVVLPFQIYYIYKLATVLLAEWPGLWVVGMFIPVLNLILLLILSGRATKAIRGHGFKIGLMGANIEEIENRIRTKRNTAPASQRGVYH